jgi:hypothetical protein
MRVRSERLAIPTSQRKLRHLGPALCVMTPRDAGDQAVQSVTAASSRSSPRPVNHQKRL